MFSEQPRKSLNRHDAMKQSKEIWRRDLRKNEAEDSLIWTKVVLFIIISKTKTKTEICKIWIH